MILARYKKRELAAYTIPGSPFRKNEEMVPARGFTSSAPPTTSASMPSAPITAIGRLPDFAVVTGVAGTDGCRKRCQCLTGPR